MWFLFKSNVSKKQKAFLLITLIGIVLFIEMYGFVFRKSNFENRMLVLNNKVRQGEPIVFSVLTIKPLNKEKSFCSVITDQELHMLGNMRALKDLDAGDVLCWEDISENVERKLSVPRGFKAYSFKPTNFLEVFAGDKVDVILTSPEKKEAITIIEGTTILRRSIHRGELSVVLAVTRTEAELLERASQQGSLSIVLRNPEDIVENHGRNLFKKSKPQIEVWTESER